MKITHFGIGGGTLDKVSLENPRVIAHKDGFLPIKGERHKSLVVEPSLATLNSSYHSYQQFDMQMRQNGSILPCTDPFALFMCSSNGRCTLADFLPADKKSSLVG